MNETPERGPGQDRKDAAEHASMRAPVIYETVRQEGVDELRRPLPDLWWSGIAAGLSLSASLYGEGFLHRHLPDAEWSPIVQNFGYCLGFLIVILGRLQLFTENTITVILPLLAEPGCRVLLAVVRLWSVVLAANLVGTIASAFCVYYLGLMTPEDLDATLAVARASILKPFTAIAAQAVPAGFLIAALVWLLPRAEGGAKFWAIVAITYLIAIGGGAHVVVGSTEVFLLIFAGEMGLGAGLAKVLLPALAGNIAGGTGLFALIAYAQVRKEL